MSRSLQPLLPVLATALLLALAACPIEPSTDDDDSASSDDDDATADDDDSASSDDDDATADDDDATADDDDSASSDDDDSAGSDDDDSAASECDTRAGGAMLDLLIEGEAIQLWFEGDAFIDEAITRVGSSGNMLMISAVVPSPDCDPAWSFHVEPTGGQWLMTAPFSDHCNVAPSAIEADPAAWAGSDPTWCPLDARLVALDDRR